jgi:hypothetical protein
MDKYKPAVIQKSTQDAKIKSILNVSQLKATLIKFIDYKSNMRTLPGPVNHR